MSKFEKVKCNDCNHEQIVFSHSSSVVKCDACNKTLVEPKASKAKIHASVTKVLT